MEYKGKLYGRVANKYIPTTMTSYDVDKMEQELLKLRGALVRIRDVCFLDDTEGVYLCDIGLSADKALAPAEDVCEEPKWLTDGSGPIKEN